MLVFTDQLLSLHPLNTPIMFSLIKDTETHILFRPEQIQESRWTIVGYSGFENDL